MRANRRRYFSLVAVSLMSITAACTSSDPFEAGADRPITFDQTTTATSSDQSDDVAAPLDPASESDSTPTSTPTSPSTPADESLLEDSSELDAGSDSVGNQPATGTDTTAPPAPAGDSGGGSPSDPTAPSARAADVGSDDAAASDSCGPEQGSVDGCIPVNDALPSTK